MNVPTTSPSDMYCCPGATDPPVLILLSSVYNSLIACVPQPIVAKSWFDFELEFVNPVAFCIKYFLFFPVPVYDSCAGINLLLSYFKFISAPFTVELPFTFKSMNTTLVPE